MFFSHTPHAVRTFFSYQRTCAQKKERVLQQVVDDRSSTGKNGVQECVRAWFVCTFIEHLELIQPSSIDVKSRTENCRRIDSSVLGTTDGQMIFDSNLHHLSCCNNP